MNPSTLARWPDVPACYEWLALDRRGQWRLRGEQVRHGGLNAFLNRHYGADADGCWRVLNGPQRVYVDLALTPWVYRSDGEAFITHSGLPAGTVRALYLTAAGDILLAASPGIGVLDDRDLPELLAACTDARGEEVDVDLWSKLLPPSTSLGSTATADKAPGGRIFWRGLPVQPLASGCDLGAHFGFCARPRP